MFMQNIRFWALYQLSKLDDVLQEETHIADEVCHNLLRYIKKMGGASGSIYKPHLCQTVLFLSKLTPKFYIKC